VAFNLSQQTDSSDLLGGFKPVGAQESLLPLLAPFQELVRRTWARWVAGHLHLPLSDVLAALGGHLRISTNCQTVTLWPAHQAAFNH
jgi:hypothetical protein